ncbi:MAG: AAA family ATPase [Anaerolineales bacterium]|nr:AAA family ATPase [Anaerolineales bacterium]
MAVATLDAGAQQRRLVTILRQLFAWRTAARPAIVVIDNGQWADEASLELMAVFTAAAERLPVLWIITSRTYGASLTPWRGRRNAQLLWLEPLKDVDSAALLATLLSSGALDAEPQQIVLPLAWQSPFLRVHRLAHRGGGSPTARGRLAANPSSGTA